MTARTWNNWLRYDQHAGGYAGVADLGRVRQRVDPVVNATIPVSTSIAERAQESGTKRIASK
ncbi:hypothetical protein [Undibacterium sp.]|uniref:hypothetical protein n=1 Tax=Undibacterium sp. TaxID=1914977 RepID=UPI002C7CF9B5|nr:hypothetical protein [Undibacterium sp.]HTD05486.1 hypothetical protein [Undibacterium sp.]